MKIIYKAWDGTEFREKSACERYEENNPCIMMYGNAGRVSNAGDAFIVALRKNGDAKRFINLCEEQKSDSTGITEGDKGLYVWDDDKGRYFYVSERIEDALKRYFED